MAYRLILGRDPESPGAIEAVAQVGNLEEVASKLLSSDEFRRRIAYGMLTRTKTQWVCAEIRHGLKIWLDLLDAGVASGVLQDNWEAAETNFILSILRPGDVFVDVGANIGWFTILAAQKVGPGGHVHAFEPRSDLSAWLTKSIAANDFTDRCTVHTVALGDRVAEMAIAAVPAERNPGHSFLVPGQLPDGAETLDAVQIRPLDAFDFGRTVRMMKVDVEGAEALVLKGAADLLSRDHPIIVSEIFPRWLRAVSAVDPRDYLRLLKDHGYCVFHLAEGGIGHEIHTFPHDSTLADDVYFSVVALSEADIERLLLRPLDRRVTSLERLLETTIAADAAALRREQERVSEAQTARMAAEQELQRVGAVLAHAQAEAANARAHAQAEAANARAQAQAEAANARASLVDARMETERARVALMDATAHARLIEARARAERERAMATARQELESLEENLRASLERADREQDRLRAEIDAMRSMADGPTAQRSALVAQLDAFQSSTIWRLTWPLRYLGTKLPRGVRRNMSRAARVIWWTATLQLPRRLRHRAAYRASLSDRPSIVPVLTADQVPSLPAESSAMALPPLPSIASESAPDEALSLLDEGAETELPPPLVPPVLMGIDRPVALIIDHLWPQPDKDSGSVDAVNMVEALIVLGYHVIFAVEHDHAHFHADRDRLAERGARCLGPDDAPSIQAFIERHGEPISLFVLARYSAGGQYPGAHPPPLPACKDRVLHDRPALPPRKTRSAVARFPGCARSRRRNAGPRRVSGPQI